MSIRCLVGLHNFGGWSQVQEVPLWRTHDGCYCIGFGHSRAPKSLIGKVVEQNECAVIVM